MLPVPIHEVVYEEMVADTEAVSRKLVAACGLEWDERLSLLFYQTKRTVQTAKQEAAGASTDLPSFGGPLEIVPGPSGTIASGVGYPRLNVGVSTGIM